MIDELLELVDRMQVGGGGQVDADHLALGRADRGEIVVGGQRRVHIGRGDAVRRHLRRVEPGTQRELARAEHLGGLHAIDRIELGLDHAHQVVGDVVGGQHVAVEAHVHRVDRLADLHVQHRLLRLRRQLVLHRVDLGV